MARRQSVRLRSNLLLAELVKAKGFTVREAAERLPCGKSMVWALMNGDRRTCSAFLAERIAEVVGVPFAVLFEPVMSKKMDDLSTERAA